MNIVVIDSGIKRSHKVFSDVNIESYELRDGELQQVMCDNDSYGHGTAVCSLICKSLKKSNIEYCLKVVKAFSEDTTSVAGLKDILEAVFYSLDADIINMSLGILDGQATEIIDICNRLLEKSIIVSAASNGGVLSIPCCLPGVIGVVSDDSLRRSDEYVWIESEAIQMAAYGKFQRVAWNDLEYFFSKGNSFACANATGIVARAVMERGKDFRKWLMENSEKGIVRFEEKGGYSIKLPYKVNRAAIFPFNKETSSLALFSDMLGFEISEIYDLPISGKIGAKGSDLLGLEVPKDYVIKNINEFNCDGIDTVIIGHTGEYIKLRSEREKIKEMIEKCNDKVNFYFLDPVKNEDRIFSPIVGNEMIPPNINGMLYYISKPVLGVYGTSSKQGKFTLQLILRNEFMKRGYHVGQLGTEPEALLFGFDAVYPMGYNSAVQIKGNDAILYLNRVLHEIEIEKEIDIIITGSQSGTVPYSCNTLRNITLPETEFLYGTSPDVAILCINRFDELEYIERTINYIESSVDSKVLAIVVYPGGKKKNKMNSVNGDGERPLEEYVEYIHAELQLPVFVLNKNMEQLCDVIIDYLQE